jgi:hypothetical protein
MDDLGKVSQNLSGIYALGKDVNAGTASAQIEPIGLRSETGFEGQFDGFGHAIKNFDLSAFSDELPRGLFASIGQLGIVRDLQVLDASVFNLFGAVGILAGRSDGLITYTFTSGSATVESVSGNIAGGLVAINTGVILRSGSSASVSSHDLLGGLVGDNSGTILQSYATGFVSGGSRSAAGGLVGGNSGLVR